MSVAMAFSVLMGAVAIAALLPYIAVRVKEKQLRTKPNSDNATG